ncbi:hypothetical protein EVAR_49678_1 [Eumeta japonica]|uniref:Uncharacterized protein n=1 Tax=Eumeta variegata TaxID=151549 RepID=A0A4C1WQC5_EUMVA|nr:hypothetical protein EVAR_49678_1 [Eumeta japonica]
MLQSQVTNPYLELCYGQLYDFKDTCELTYRLDIYRSRTVRPFKSYGHRRDHLPQNGVRQNVALRDRMNKESPTVPPAPRQIGISNSTAPRLFCSRI